MEDPKAKLTEDPQAHERELLPFRLILIVAIIVNPLLGLLVRKVDPTLYNPMGERILLSIAFLLLLIFSFKSKFINRHFISFTYGMFFLGTIWTISVLAQNNFNPEIGIVYLLVFFVICLSFQKPMEIVLFTVGNIVALNIAFLFTTEPHLHPGVLETSILITAFFAYVFLQNRINLEGKIFETNEALVNQMNLLKNSDEKLRRSEHQLAKAQEISHIGSYEWDLKADQLEWSDEHYRLFGLNPFRDNITFEKFKSMIHPDDLERLIDVLNESIEKRTPFEQHFRIIRPDGSIRYLLTIGEVQADEKGKAAKVIGVGHDLTYIRTAEKKFEGLLESAPFAILLCNEQGQVVMTNVEAIEEFGYQTEELLHRHISKIIPEVDWDSLIFRAYNNEEREFEASALRKDKTILPVCININLIEAEGSNLVSISVSDLSMLKKSEKEVNEHKVELEKYAYIASHNLKEPLRLISIYTQLLKNRYQDQLDEEGQKYVSIAVTNVKKMTSIIDDLLAYSHLQDGNSAGKVASGELVKEVVEEAKLIYSDKKPKISFKNLPVVNFDTLQLKKVFYNLIENAIKFNENPNPEINISSTEKDQEWLFLVEDNGIGIDRKYSEKVFDFFQRLNVKSEYPGNGIGLTQCKKIIEKAGGKIWFESQPGKGTTFYFSIIKPNEKELNGS